MRQPHHAGRYSIDELQTPPELLSEGETEEVKGGSEWSSPSTSPCLYGPLLPMPVLIPESVSVTQED